MGKVVKLAEDGKAIDFQISDTLPSSLKKFRRSLEVEGFYRFVYENDLRFEAAEILDRIILRRRKEKKSRKKK